MLSEINESKLDRKQICGLDNLYNNILSVLVKKTYFLTNEGKVIDQNDIFSVLEDDMTFYKNNKDLLEHDVDTFPFKMFTDLIIKGNARSVSPVTSFISELQIQNRKISFLITGKRKAFLSSGKIKFASPELIQEVPLRYDFAYGGIDSIAEEKFELPPENIRNNVSHEIDWVASSPYRYPRNPIGKGYLVELNNRALELLELPLIEDPEDLLSPETIAIKDPMRWVEMPLPRATGWVNPTWFPRVSYLGIIQFQIRNSHTLKEIKRSWVDLDLLKKRAMENAFNLRFTNGASLGLQFPYLKPGEKIRLLNIHPKSSDFVLHLPTEYPSIWVDGRKGKLIETKPVIHTVVIEPDENRLSIVWRGSAPALRPYHEEELKTMPYKVEWNEK